MFVCFYLYIHWIFAGNTSSSSNSPIEYFKVIQMRKNATKMITISGNDIFIQKKNTPFKEGDDVLMRFESVPGGERLKYGDKYLCMQKSPKRITVCNATQLNSHYMVWTINTRRRGWARLKTDGKQCIIPGKDRDQNGKRVGGFRIKKCRIWDYKWKIRDIAVPIEPKKEESSSSSSSTEDSSSSDGGTKKKNNKSDDNSNSKTRVDIQSVNFVMPTDMPTKSILEAQTRMQHPHFHQPYYSTDLL